MILKKTVVNSCKNCFFEERLRKLFSSSLLENVCNGDDLMEKAVLNNIRARMVTSWPNEKDVLLSSNQC